MLYKDICKILGYYLMGFSLTFFIPLFVAAYYQFEGDPVSHPQPYSTNAFFLSFLLTALFGSFFYWIGKKTAGHLYRREALALVVIIWFLTPLVSSFPFLLSGTLNNPVHAYFESVSGLTTTGSTILQAKKYNGQGKEIPIQKKIRGSMDTHYAFYGNVNPIKDKEGKILYAGVEALDKGLLFWRSFLHFLGGGGIVLLFIAILPAIGLGAKMLFQAEMTGSPLKGTLAPRIKESAFLLWKIYTSLTMLQVILLVITNSKMSIFDAVTLSFATLSTGGFTVHPESVGYYKNVCTDWIVIFFMILGSINFSLYFFVLRGKFYKLYEPEFLLFILIILGSCLFCMWGLTGTQKLFYGSTPGTFSLLEAFHYGSFQMISMLTTTGFAIADYDYWPYPIQTLLLLAMFLGGMSGSTAGGMKILRGFMLYKIGSHTVESLFRPETVRHLRIADKEIHSGTAKLVLVFFLTLVTFTVLSTFIYIIWGIDPETALGIVAAMVTNTGIGFRIAGPYDSMAFLSNGQLLLASFLMILGRLEFFALLTVLVPAFWKVKT